MPDENIARIYEWLSSLPAPVQAFIAAAVITPLRVMYFRREFNWWRLCLEGVLCGSLAWGFFGGFKYFGLSSDAAVFVGAVIGFIGVEKSREILFSMLGGVKRP